MSDISYKPLIQDMKWSYSRIETFENCPYQWYLKYICNKTDEKMFYATHGKFIHEVLEKFYRGELKRNELTGYYLSNYNVKVQGRRPPGDIPIKYMKSGVEYLRNFTPLPYTLLGVEQRIDFDIGTRKFVGIIDYIGEKNGDIYIVDNKSRNLKPRSKRSKPTAKDAELDNMLKQLYLYSEAIKHSYGIYPKKLCFNCFRNGEFIEEDFSEDKFDSAVDWANKTIDVIENTNEFWPNENQFMCTWLCGLNEKCKYAVETKEEWRRYHR